MAIAGRRETGKHFCHSSSCCWKSYKGVRLIFIEVNVLVIKSNHLSHDEVTVDVDRDVSTYQLPCTAVIGLFFILVIGALEEMSPICVAWLHNTCVFVFSFLTSKINIPPFTLNGSPLLRSENCTLFQSRRCPPFWACSETVEVCVLACLMCFLVIHRSDSLADLNFTALTRNPVLKPRHGRVNSRSH